MALSRLQQKIQEVITSQTLIFRSDEAKNSWIREVENVFASSGDEIIIAKKNRVQVSAKAFEDNILDLARPFTLNASNAKYVPGIIDGRSKEEKLAATKDIEKLIDFYIEKMGLVFNGEHLGDSSLRQSVKSLISTNYLFESGNDDGEIVFRRSHMGMFGSAIDPPTLIHLIAASFLDNKRTAWAQGKIEREIKQKALENLGYPDPDKLNVAQLGFLEKEIADLKADSLKSYTTKRLPVLDKEFYRQELRLRGLHQNGKSDETNLSLHEKRWLDGYADQGLKALDELPDIRIEPKPIEWQSWPGLSSVENDKGIFLSPERMALSELSGFPPFIETTV